MRRTLLLLLAGCLAPGVTQAAPAPEVPAAACEWSHGAIVRGPVDAKRIAWVFTGHEFAEGGETILEALATHRAPATFSFTGDFLRTPAFAPLVRRMLAAGHVVGPHSDKHLLCCDWTERDTTLVTREAFERDVRDNLRELARFGVEPAAVRYWVPSYEWFNREVSAWSLALGLQVFSFTPGPRANADYTSENDPRFVSSAQIVENLLTRERDDPRGLNGFVILQHVGAGPGRRDKMHDHLGGLLAELKRRGYEFVRVNELLDRCARP